MLKDDGNIFGNKGEQSLIQNQELQAVIVLEDVKIQYSMPEYYIITNEWCGLRQQQAMTNQGRENLANILGTIRMQMDCLIMDGQPMISSFHISVIATPSTNLLPRVLWQRNYPNDIRKGLVPSKNAKNDRCADMIILSAPGILKCSDGHILNRGWKCLLFRIGILILLSKAHGAAGPELALNRNVRTPTLLLRQGIAGREKKGWGGQATTVRLSFGIRKFSA